MIERFHTPRPAISALGDAGEQSVGHPVQFWRRGALAWATHDFQDGESGANGSGQMPGDRRCTVSRRRRRPWNNGAASTNQKDSYFLALP
jgi:hypothetical protein